MLVPTAKPCFSCDGDWNDNWEGALVDSPDHCSNAHCTKDKCNEQGLFQKLPLLVHLLKMRKTSSYFKRVFCKKTCYFSKALSLQNGAVTSRTWNIRTIRAPSGGQHPIASSQVFAGCYPGLGWTETTAWQPAPGNLSSTKRFDHDGTPTLLQFQHLQIQVTFNRQWKNADCFYEECYFNNLVQTNN